MYGRLFFLNKPVPHRPAEEKYVVEIEGMERKSFVEKNDAILFMYDNGITSYQYFTKEVAEYINIKQIPFYELWRIEHRVGFVLYDFEYYTDENNATKKRKSYVWRFVGYGKPCFAPNKESLKEKVQEVVMRHLEDPDKRGLNEYPYFTKCYR